MSDWYLLTIFYGSVAFFLPDCQSIINKLKSCSILYIAGWSNVFNFHYYIFIERKIIMLMFINPRRAFMLEHCSHQQPNNLNKQIKICASLFSLSSNWIFSACSTSTIFGYIWRKPILYTDVHFLKLWG